MTDSQSPSGDVDTGKPSGRRSGAYREQAVRKRVAELVIDRLGLEAVDRACAEALFATTLAHVAKVSRQNALDVPGDEFSCWAAAAAELLGVTDEDDFAKLLVRRPADLVAGYRHKSSLKNYISPRGL